MTGKSFKIFSIFGFDIKIDASWVFVAIFVTWSLGKGYFPQKTPGLMPEEYWLMGVLGAAGLFFSILFHEIHHSLVARHYGIKIRGITLFIFGGVAEMENEPPSAKSEFWIAIMGPVSSLYLGAFLHLGKFIPLPLSIASVVAYLSLINIILAVFNMIPAFPLDGGRVLRAFLWNLRGSLKSATKTASLSGNIFGTLFIVLGLLNLLGGNFIGAIWWFLIGMFLRNAANMSMQQLLLRNMMNGEMVAGFMSRNPVTVNPGITVRRFIEDYVYSSHHKMYPVKENGETIGCINTRKIAEIPKSRWDKVRVRELMFPLSEENSIEENVDMMLALGKINNSGHSRLMVMKRGKLVGILSLKDILELLAIRIDLENKD